MILVDTDVQSAMAKMGRAQLLVALLQTLQIRITHAIFADFAE